MGLTSCFLNRKRAINNTCLGHAQLIMYLVNDNLPGMDFVFATGAPLAVMNIGRTVRRGGRVE